ncbi:hypothetical protein ILFOPFJJ_06902 [Ensifer psoraleae]|nr:hypothetical protein [Sinorhizobium psoraleae]
MEPPRHRLSAGLRFSEMGQCGTDRPIATGGVLLIPLDIFIQRLAGKPISNAHLVVLTQVVTEAPKSSCIHPAGLGGCFVFILFDESRVLGIRIQLSAVCDRHDSARRLPGPEMTYCRKESRGLVAELARIIGQRPVVEPSKGLFVICEEPAAKAEKATHIVLGGAFGGAALDEGLLKPRKERSILGIKRLLAAPNQNPS